jgi:hypothetical protein
VEDTRSLNSSQANSLPDGFFVGVIPPDGTVFSTEILLIILKGIADDETALLTQFRRKNIPYTRLIGTTLVDATHIRRLVHLGKEVDGQEA